MIEKKAKICILIIFRYIFIKPAISRKIEANTPTPIFPVLNFKNFHFL